MQKCQSQRIVTRKGNKGTALKVHNQNNQPADDVPEKPVEINGAQALEPLPKSNLMAAETAHKSKLSRLKHALLHKKKFTIPAIVVALVLILAAIPYTRYALAATVMRQTYTVTVFDDNTKEVVSSATVTLDGHQVATDKNGIARIKSHVGTRTLAISKKYYKNLTTTVTVPILKQKNGFVVTLAATGRQVPIIVTNKLNGKPADNITIKAADTQVKTDKDGKVTIVLPAGSKTLPGIISGSGYNSASITIAVTEAAVKENSFSVTPAGKVYFLSKRSGKIDVVKTNLDGSERQTVLPGTGKEEDGNTVLLASRDWKYLALLSRRDGDKAKLYLIETTGDKVSTIDEGDASFSLSGWNDNYFVYTVTRNTVAANADKKIALKSFNVESKQLSTIDESKVETIGGGYYSTQPTNVYLLQGRVLYSTEFNATPYYMSGPPSMKGTIISVRSDGSDKKILKTFDAAYNEPSGWQAVPVRAVLPLPNSPEFLLFHGELSEALRYNNGTLTNIEPDYNRDTQTYKTYLQSPSGKQTFWYEPRDGKNTLLIGDADAASPKRAANQEGFTAYGWYTDNYLLVSKGGSELFILPAGTDEDAFVMKISDYHKPIYSYYGYGGGYGGL